MHGESAKNSGHGSLTGPADRPPLPHNATISHDKFQKLHKWRIQNQRLKQSLGDEEEKLESLQQEDQAIRAKITKGAKIVQKLANQAGALDEKYKKAEDLYRTGQANLETLRYSVEKMRGQWTKEAEEFNEVLVRLQRMRGQKQKLASELADVSEECSTLAEELGEALTERERLELLLARAEESNREANEFITRSSVEVQTNCDFEMITEIERVRSEVHHQLQAMKKVKDSIELVRRCS